MFSLEGFTTLIHEWLTNHSDGDGVGVGELDGTTGLLKIDRPLGN